MSFRLHVAGVGCASTDGIGKFRARARKQPILHKSAKTPARAETFGSVDQEIS